MSDYKIVNGKKVRVCKYGCDTELVWSDKISGFIETKGGLTHTQDRCKQVKSKPIHNSVMYPEQGPNGRNDLSLEVVLKKLKSVGITLDLEVLRNATNGGLK